MWAKIFMRIYNSVFIKMKGKLWEGEKKSLYFLFSKKLQRAEATVVLTWGWRGGRGNAGADPYVSLGRPATPKYRGQHLRITKVSK